MHISPYSEYAVTYRQIENPNSYQTSVCVGSELFKNFIERTMRVDTVHSYEIYTKNPETGEGGWDIMLVRSTDNLIEHFPHFDCIITKNDCTPETDWLDYQTFIDNHEY